MIYIAHRGLADGPDPKRENHPKQIERSLADGWECEVDVWLIDGQWSLGHDGPQWKVSFSFLHQGGLWLHCKNLEALHHLSATGLHFFAHDNDHHVLTSQRKIWTYPLNALTPISICVQPEWEADWRKTVANLSCYGICSKHVQEIRMIRSVI